MNLDLLVAELIRDEDLKLKPYVDSVGKITLGVGRNLEDKGISKTEALYLLENDIDECVADLATFPWFARLPEGPQRAVLNLRFNLGPTRFRRWAPTLAYLERGDLTGAARQFRTNRKYFKQVGARAERIALLLETTS